LFTQTAKNKKGHEVFSGYYPSLAFMAFYTSNVTRRCFDVKAKRSLHLFRFDKHGPAVTDEEGSRGFFLLYSPTLSMVKRKKLYAITGMGLGE
jgi:hypothetical protein